MPEPKSRRQRWTAEVEAIWTQQRHPLVAEQVVGLMLRARQEAFTEAAEAARACCSPRIRKLAEDRG